MVKTESKESLWGARATAVQLHDLESTLDTESGRPSTLIERNGQVSDNHDSLDPTTVPTARDWSGPDDPDNPMNWPFALRVYHATIPGVIGFTVTLGSSIYTPGVHSISERFNISETVALLGLSLYVLGLAFGPVVAAPLSETFGRRIVYLLSLPLSSFFILGAGFSQSFASLAVCRFFAGFFGSPTLAVGAGTNADLWLPVHRAVSTSCFLLAPFAGPVMGPIIGGYAVTKKGWPWTEWTLLFFTAASLLYCLPMKETYKKIILQNRAKKLGIPPPPKGPTGAAGLKFLLVITLFRPVHMLFAEPIVAFFSLYIGFNFSVLFGLFDAFPIVFEGVYGFSVEKAGLPWLGVLVGVTLATITLIILDRCCYRKQFELSRRLGKGGLVAPEHRLYGAMAGSLGVSIGLFWFAWTARHDVHWIIPVVASVPFAWGNLCVFVRLSPNPSLYLAGCCSKRASFPST